MNTITSQEQSFLDDISSAAERHFGDGGNQSSDILTRLLDDLTPEQRAELARGLAGRQHAGNQAQLRAQYNLELAELSQKYRGTGQAGMERLRELNSKWRALGLEL